MTKPKPFNNPFGKLKLEKKPEPQPSPKAAPPGYADELARAKALARERSERLSEDERWTLATDGVAPLADRSERRRPAPSPQARAPEPLDPELAAYDHLRGLVDHLGAGPHAKLNSIDPLQPFDLSDTDEFVEGAVQGLDPRILKRLRRGDYAVQGSLDLHGMTREEAKPALLAFLQQARVAGKRCVLLVHGRGLHSKDQVPVLKEAVRRWLSSERFAQSVLAFSTARQHDGGAGALYLLLRKQ